MNSQAAEKKLGLDARCWKPWPIDVATVPKSPGVYLFRIAGGAALPRVKSGSDIVYVGSGVVRDRLRAHSRQDWKNWSGTGWVIRLISLEKGQEVAWQELSRGRAMSVEGDVLQQFLVDHFGLPPANSRKPPISPETGALLALLSLTPEGREHVLKERQRLVTEKGEEN